MLVRRQPAGGARLQRRGPAPARFQRRAHRRGQGRCTRLLYREGLHAGAGARGASRRWRRKTPEAARRRRADAGLPGACRRQRGIVALSPMEPRTRASRMVAGEASGDLLAGLLLDGMRAALAGAAAARHRRAADGERRASRPGGRTTSWPCAATSRCCATTARSSASAASCASACCASRPDAFIGVDAPDFNLDLEAALQARRHQTVHFVCPSIWAWRAGARREDPRAAADHVLCIFPFEPELLARHGIAATYVGPSAGQRDPDGARPGRRARARWACADDDEVVAILPGSRALRGRVPGAPLLRRRPRCCSSARPGIRFVVPAVPALQRGASRRRPARPACADGLQVVDRPVARRAGRLRRDADRQRHGHAGGGAVQAADGDRLPHELADLRGSCGASSCSPGWACPTSCAASSWCPSCCRTTPRPQSLAAAVLEWLDAPARMAAVQERFSALHHELRRDTATLATDAIEKVLEALSRRRLDWDPLGPDGRRRRSRPRAAGRPGGGRGRDPGRHQAHPRPGRFQGAHAAAARHACTTRSARRRCAARWRRPASRRSTHSTSCTPPCWR